MLVVLIISRLDFDCLRTCFLDTYCSNTAQPRYMESETNNVLLSETLLTLSKELQSFLFSIFLHYWRNFNKKNTWARFTIGFYIKLQKNIKIHPVEKGLHCREQKFWCLNPRDILNCCLVMRQSKLFLCPLDNLNFYVWGLDNPNCSWVLSLKSCDNLNCYVHPWDNQTIV